MKFLFRTIVFISVIFLTACAVGPDYRRPPVNIPYNFKEAKNQTVMKGDKPQHRIKHHGIKWKRAYPQDLCHRGRWWLIFQDRRLNHLEDQLNSYNQSIVNAYYNYKQARALVDEARAALFPTLTATLSELRQKTGGGTASFVSSSSNGSTSTNTASFGGSGGSSTISNSHNWFLSGSWEPDIWGATRRAIEASIAGAQSSAALYSATRLSSQGLLAQTYFQLRGLDSVQRLLNNTVTSYKKSLALTKHRYVAGVAPRSDVVQAQSVLEAAEAQAINNGILRGQYEHAIAVLIGLPPAEFSIPFSPLTATPPTIPLEFPSEMLERRPDIAQAERLIAQANAQIGVAISAYFPTLTLTGTASTGGNGFGPLLSVPSLSWSLGAQAAATILDGGLRDATVKAAVQGYRASAANYRQVVLAAFQDVEDNLISLRILKKQAVVERQAVNSARLALQLIINQYKSGTVDYTSVMTAQANAFSIEQIAVNIQYLRMVSAVGLIKALGGGWECSNLTKRCIDRI